MDVQLVKLGNIERMDREGERVEVAEAVFAGEGTTLSLEVKVRGEPSSVSMFLQNLGATSIKDIISVSLKPNVQKKMGD